MGGWVCVWGGGERRGREGEGWVQTIESTRVFVQARTHRARIQAAALEASASNWLHALRSLILWQLVPDV